MIRLRPRFTRIALSMDSMILIGIFFGYFFDGYLHGKWWSLGYLCSFSVALVVTPLLAWFMFVPRVLEYSETDVRIVTIFRDTLHSWEHLKLYRDGTVFFVLRFKHELQGYQIMPKAYSDADWNRFTDFIESRFSDRES